MRHLIPAQLVLNWLLLHHELIDWGTRVISACAFLHAVLPPWDWEPKFVTEGLADFPTAQATFRRTFHNRWYKLLIYVVGFIGLHMRSTLYRFISVKNANGPNANDPSDAVIAERAAKE